MGHQENTNQETAGCCSDMRENQLQGKTVLWDRKLLHQPACDLPSSPRTISVFVLFLFQVGGLLSDCFHCAKHKTTTLREKCLLTFSSIFICSTWHACFKGCFWFCLFVWCQFWSESLCCVCHRAVSPLREEYKS